jgi:PAP2 superfamily protein
MKKLLLLLLVLGWPGLARADAVLDWNETAASAGFAAGLDNEFGCVDPLHESRIFAMMHAAIHDALNAIDRRSQPYAFDGQAAAGTSPEAAVAAAAHDVLVVVFPQLPGELGLTPAAATDLVNAAYAAALAAIPDTPAKAQGILIGQAAAAAILALRAADGADTPPFLDFTYVPGPNPGDFQFIPGYPPFAAFTGWGKVTPFVLTSSSRHRPKAPYALSSKKYAADFNEVKSLGAVDSTTRTAEQTEIALFWVEGSPQGWNRIARIVSVQHGLDLWQSARLFGLLNLASADAYIADFENKYFYEFWRPITAIRAADTDGNPDTVADPTWDSLVVVGPVPEYPSGHSGQGGAMSEVLARFFGDRVSFSTTATTQPGVTRSFTSFSQAAEENGNSRIYVGYHFRHAVTEGIKLGSKVGKVAFNHYLQPVH